MAYQALNELHVKGMNTRVIRSRLELRNGIRRRYVAEYGSIA
jgi:hypothetical protein